MSSLISTVKTAIADATAQFHQQMENDPSTVLKLSENGATLADMTARAAVKATLMHMRDNVSDGAKAAAWKELRVRRDKYTIGFMIQAALSHTLSELEEGK